MGTLQEAAGGDKNRLIELPTDPASEISRKVCAQLKLEAATHLNQLIDSVDGYSTSELLAALFELDSCRERIS